MGGWALLIELDLPGRGEIPLEKQRRELEELIRVGPAGTRFWRRGGWDDFKIFKNFFLSLLLFFRRAHPAVKKALRRLKHEGSPGVAVGAGGPATLALAAPAP